MCHVNNEWRKTINDGQNRTTKSRKNHNTRSKGNLQVLGNTGSGHHLTTRDERKKFLKVFLRRTRKLLETKLHRRNLIKVISIKAVPLVRYSGPFLKWTKEELQQMDQKTRKPMMMRKALDSWDDIDGLYVLRKEEGILASIEDSVDTSIRRLEDGIKKRAKKDGLQPPERTHTTQGLTE